MKKEWPMGHHAKSRPNLLRQTSTTMESEQKNIFMDSWPCRHCKQTIKIGISMGSSSKSAFSIFPSPKVWAQSAFPNTVSQLSNVKTAIGAAVPQVSNPPAHQR